MTVFMAFSLVLSLLLTWEVAVPTQLHATLITSAQTGDWSQVSTWIGDVVPGDGDNVIIADGHTVTIPAGYTAIAGTSPPNDESTPAIQPASSTGTGVLIINGTLRFRGSIKQANATWIANAGAVIEHDSSLAIGKPGYTWQISMADHQPHAVLRLAGTGRGSKRVQVKNALGSERFAGFTNGATGRDGGFYPHYDGYSNGGNIHATFTTFTSLGNGSIEWLTAKPNHAASVVIFDNCIISDSTHILFLEGGLHENAILRMKNTSILDPIQLYSTKLYINTNLDKGIRLFEDCLIEGVFGIAYGKDITIRHTAFAGTPNHAPISPTGVSIIQAALVEDIFVYNRNIVDSGDSTMPSGQLSRIVSLRKAATSDDDHFRHSGSDSNDVIIDGAVLEYAGTSSDGDGFVFELDASEPIYISIKNVLILPNIAGNISQVMATFVAGLSNYNITIENNTMIGQSSFLGPSIFLIELTTNAPVGMVSSLSNNLIWSPTPGAIGVMEHAVASTLLPGTITKANYNNIYNGPADAYISTDDKFRSPPGANDLSVDPQFVDDTRDFLSWGQTIDPSHASWDDIYAEIRKLNDDSGYDPAYDWTYFYTWVRAGFAPTNPVLQGAGERGADIGAVAVRRRP